MEQWGGLTVGNVALWKLSVLIHVAMAFTKLLTLLAI